MAKRRAKRNSRKSTNTTSPFSKLDPSLLLGASHTKLEHKLGIVKRLKPGVNAATSKLGIGLRSFADRMSTTAARDYVRRDLVPVLIEGGECADIEKQVRALGGTSTPLTSTKVVARVPRSKLKALASHAGVGY